MSPTLASRTADFAQWYLDVVRGGDLARYSPVRGCIVVRPYGFALWEHIRDALDRRIKDTGHANIYLPLLVPESLLLKEAEHVEGFAPQVAWVTHGGADELSERLAIRPTSEALIGEIYRDEIQSYRDLPVLVNQWANVVRWELRTRPFLRTAEFLWQEGHTFHETAAQAREEAGRMLGIYREIWRDWLAIPTIIGRKSESERFPGADDTLTGEALMGDGRALQMGTSHDLGQNFARAFDIQFLDRANKRRHPYGTSWGFSWRTIGAIVMVHGDERGLVLPPRIAPIQVVIVPIWRTGAERVAVEAAIEEAGAAIQARTVFGDQSVRVEIDWRDHVTPGFKFNEWEQRGVPIRLEVGPRDVSDRTIVIVPRIATSEGMPTREVAPVDEAAGKVVELLENLQSCLLARAESSLRTHTRAARSWDGLVGAFDDGGGFVVSGWCGSADCERAVRDATGATLRVLPFPGEIAKEDASGGCVRCDRRPAELAVFARAY
jgi:prolyl-tRNA synthetase